jgi:branched-chain amino acid transport system ATP-binding protein
MSPPGSDADAVLAVEGLSVRYGGIWAVSDVGLAVRESQIMGLIGPNGAGKTTFVDAITGFTPAASGRVCVGGRDISSLSPDERSRAGLTRTWQSAELFDELTVRANVAVAAGRPPWRQLAREILTGRPRRDDRAEEILSRLGLSGLADERPDRLTTGQRKLVGVARAMAPEPRVVCLDEPAAGLDAAESVLLGRQLRQLARDGTAMLLIDHDTGLVLSVCDHVVVLESGRIIASGPPEEIRSDPRVVAAYLGGVAAEVLGGDDEAAGTGTAPAREAGA